MKLTISLAQMSLQFGEAEANFARAADWIAEAAGCGSDLILLPELWASGYDLPNWPRYATSLGEGLFARLAALARQHRIAIGSSLLERAGQQVYNTFALFGADGQILGVYRKIHLFRLLDEQNWLTAGQSLTLTETPWGPIGLAICYDLRFPEMFRPYAVAGSPLVLLVAEWPERRIAAWSKLLQARAIENQLFVAAVNKVGYSQGVKLGGCSAVIDPWGTPLVEGEQEEALLTVTIDLREAEKTRKYIPALSDRRPEIYLRPLQLESEQV